MLVGMIRRNYTARRRWLSLAAAQPETAKEVAEDLISLPFIVTKWCIPSAPSSSSSFALEAGEPP